MKINNKSLVKPFKINNKYVIIRYGDWNPNTYELYLEDEPESPHPILYIYGPSSNYIFGQYDESRSIFIDLDEQNIKQKIWNLLLETATNACS